LRYATVWWNLWMTGTGLSMLAKHIGSLDFSRPSEIIREKW
jgi:hypothetical protein